MPHIDPLPATWHNTKKCSHERVAVRGEFVRCLECNAVVAAALDEEQEPERWDGME